MLARLGGRVRYPARFRTLVVCLMATLPVMAAGVGQSGAPALAQQAGAVACPAVVDRGENSGLLTIRIRSECRRGQKVRATYGYTEFQAQFDAEGAAKFDIVLTEPKGEVVLQYTDRAQEKVDATFASLPVVLRISILWDTPVDLNLHVVEPRGIVGGMGDAAVVMPGAASRTLGKIDLNDDGLGFGPFQESYVLANRLQSPDVTFWIGVENASRGRVPAGAHCQGGEYAKVPLTIVVADRGVIKKRNFELVPQPCGLTLDDRAYFQRLHY